MSVIETIISAVTNRLLRPLAVGSIAAAALLAAGCTDKRGGPIPYNVANFGVPDAPTTADVGTDHKITPMDTLSIKVFRVPDLTGDYAVDLLGRISLPLVGEVVAANRTPEQLDRLLTEKLGEKYFENPDVSVGIKTSMGRMVTVDGAVKKPGSFQVRPPLSLMEAVALAGGADDEANLRRVAVFRTIGGERQAAAFDLVSIRKGEAPDPQLYIGDVVVVDGSSLKDTTKMILQAIRIGVPIFRPVVL